MFADYVLRGLKAGLVAGLAFGLFVALVGNPMVGFAETAGHDHAEHDHADAAVSEHATELVSVAAGVCFGGLLGAVFGLAYYFLEPGLPGGDAASYVLAAAGFVTVSGAPWLVLPPRPAGVEQTLGADARLSWYAAMMVAGALTCAFSGYAYRRLESRSGRPAAVAGAAVPLALLAVSAGFAPANPTHGAVPAGLAASFSGLVVFGQVGLWSVLASGHAWLLRRDRRSPDVDSRSVGAGRHAD
ncbi:CbtA family protein [Halorussus sp. MSC15.2]|uniref:CbtA family protein n=1 Tax=Halorussus sp. MSC15.2 TaxID=2283638 RepID=UPI0013D437C9|nr:CbtA family protein [Halorussus sp. MSC15.2]NEU58219.1 CbtA family protein [Halorussus sp. MSC15.2]